MWILELTWLIYWILLAPTIVFISNILRKSFPKTNPKLIPLIAFLLLQLLPLPRGPVGHVNGPVDYEPWAIGFGFPISIFKFYLDGSGSELLLSGLYWVGVLFWAPAFLLGYLLFLRKKR